MALHPSFLSISPSSSQRQKHDTKNMCKVLYKFFKRCKKVGFTTNLGGSTGGTTRVNSCRGDDRGNVGTTMDVSKVSLTSSSSLKDHLAATKIQSAYRRHMNFRTKTVSCRTAAGIMTKECSKHSSSEKSKPYDIQLAYRSHLSRASISKNFIHEVLLQIHTLMLRCLRGLVQIQPRKASHALDSDSPNYDGSDSGSSKNKIPHSQHKKIDNWKLHLEPKSRKRTIQQHLPHFSILDCYSLCSSAPHRSLRASSVDDAGQVPVYLNVYDITPINCCLYWLGLGAHHSGVQVNEAEYAFGINENGRVGIFKTDPKECEEFTFRKEILIGWTKFSAEEVYKVIKKLDKQYQLKDYHLITNNCNHFSTEVCIRLTGNSIPRWVNRIARIGTLFVRLANWSKKKKGKCREKETSLEKDVKTLSRSKMFMGSTNSSTSFLSLSSDITVTGKSSRWKKSVTLSSHLDWII